MNKEKIQKARAQLETQLARRGKTEQKTFLSSHIFFQLEKWHTC